MAVTRNLSLIALGVAAALVGCGPQAKIAPVSGTVTLNGEPLADATVRFLPKPQEDPDAVMMLAKGKTDASGAYSLRVYDGPEGAVVGANRVTITTAVEAEDGEGLVAKERVPPQYNVQSKLEFDVPPGGTDAADFQLTGEKARR
ncbi:hypothetical protein [Botrimarina sp.]|uniref:hypothetical protein n=1 Tax=Botrimarina sp. TaxID=2795802 RepID=UPI0032EF2A8E